MARSARIASRALAWASALALALPGCVLNFDDAVFAPGVDAGSSDAGDAGDADATPQADAACTAEHQPVCGRDGVTYPNACEAARSGAIVVGPGVCAGEPCGGSTGASCVFGAYCQLADGACVADGPRLPAGTCVGLPLGCGKVYEPVCGCDGHTYDNRCFAAVAGANVADAGACPAERCGGIAGLRCAAGQQCWFAEGECRVPDAMGTCVAIGGACPLSYEPVCGCDGLTHGNACEARAAGTSVWYAGACAQDACGGTTSVRCGAASFCQYDPGLCGAGEGAGRCVARPQICPELLAPVCGCDGSSYANACEAEHAGVSLLHVGACG